ncbi:hypothetical protein KIN20_024611 [Parelaphostrongylus tenuis]|uniref:Secreted protein n=1 Tax=Parelaphostrongylus tenuis TaxID=148309 RepID=A0AAD5QXM6_PARTN|nr:hypothetical protein KIN20_024611 [Parelaphostrongylus tenuis]
MLRNTTLLLLLSVILSYKIVASARNRPPPGQYCPSDLKIWVAIFALLDFNSPAQIIMHEVTVLFVGIRLHLGNFPHRGRRQILFKSIFFAVSG